MLYVLLALLILAAFIYVGWRLTSAHATGSRTRVIGPDDDPDFLGRLGNGDQRPR